MPGDENTNRKFVEVKKFGLSVERREQTRIYNSVVRDGCC